MEACSQSPITVPVKQFTSCSNPGCSGCHRNGKLTRSRSKVMRDLEVKDRAGGELTGILTLLLCAMYAFALFLIAALFGSVSKKVESSVKNVHCRIGYSKEQALFKMDLNNNDRKRTISHG